MNIQKTNLDAMFVFIKPPSMEELARRLRAMGSESDDAITQRLDCAQREMECSEQGAYDKIIVNDDLDKAYAELEDFILGGKN